MKHGRGEGAVYDGKHQGKKLSKPGRKTTQNKIDGFHRTLHYLNKLSKKKGCSNFSEFIARRIVNDGDSALMSKFVDKWFPNISKIENQHSLSPDAKKDLATLVHEMRAIENERKDRDKFKRLKKDEIIAEYREMGEKL